MPSPAFFVTVAVVLACCFKRAEQSVIFPECALSDSSGLQKRSDFLLCDQTCSGREESFETEDILQKMFGRRMNITRLVIEYSLICPLDDTCGKDIDQSYVYSGTRDNDAFKDCPKCTCNSLCLSTSTCCPGCYYGYIEHECSNFQAYPKDSDLVPTIGKCADRANMNSSLTEMCTREFKPCQLSNSCLVYKNKHCAICNGETETCLDLDLITECPQIHANNIASPLSSHKSVIDFIDFHKCRIAYRAYNQHICKLKDETRISSCNVTGLWTEYDGEIEWACEHFRTPYGNFKNVFCYICNPSISNTNITSVVQNECPDQLSSPVPEGLSDACKNLPSIKRLFPYKNIYCMACNTQSTDSVYNLDSGNLVIKSETVDYSTLTSDVQLSIRLYGFDLEEKLLRILETSFNRFPSTPDTFILNHHHNSTNAYIKASSKEIMDEYQAVCGTASGCPAQNGSNSLMASYSNKACGDINCSCDNMCASRFNCCPEFLLQRQPYSTLLCAFNDVNHNNSIDDNETPHGSDECHESWDQPNKVILLSTCMTEHNNETIRNKCESMEFDSDILKYIPVSNGEQIAYRNVYCLLCNQGNDVSVATVTLSMQFQCNTFLELKLVDTLEHLLDIVNLSCDKYNFFPKSHPASFSTDVRYYNGSLTYCRKKECTRQPDNTYLVNQITHYDKCNITGNWLDKSDLIQSTCEDTSSANILALKPYKHLSRVYKNVACFICNPQESIGNGGNILSVCVNRETDLDKYLSSLCDTANGHPSWVPYKNLYCTDCNLTPLEPVQLVLKAKSVLVPYYTYIFTMSETDFSEIFKSPVDVPVCDNGMIDTVTGECRQKFCFDGYVLENNFCVTPVQSVVNTRYIIDFAVIYKGPKNGRILVDLYDFAKNITDKIALGLNSHTVYFLEYLLFRTTGGCGYLESSDNETQDFLYESVDITRTEAIYVSAAIDIYYSPDSLGDRMVLVDVKRSSYFVLSNQHNSPALIRLQNTVEEGNILTSTPKFCHPISYSRNINLIRRKLVSPVKYTNLLVDKFLFCPMVRFSPGEISISVITKRVTIKSLNRTFDTHMFVVKNRFAYICEDYLPSILTFKNIERRKPPLEDALNTTTRVCTVLSIACLSLTFITYCIFPKLRENVVGKTNMLLCLVLSVAQALLQFGINKAQFRNVCAMIGVLIHFLLVCSYCTMNVCAFNMYKICYVNRLIRDKRVQFRKYLTYMLMFPFSLVGLMVVINLFTSNWTEIGYGKVHCFISDFHQMIFFFFLPSACIFLANACFFSLAYYAIRSSPTVSGKQDRRDFVLYVKLCSVVGLTWPLLIIDNLIGLTWFSFIASGLNALQGVFIFFSYVTNRRVVFMYQGLISASKSSQTPS